MLCLECPEQDTCLQATADTACKTLLRLAASKPNYAGKVLKRMTQFSMSVSLTKWDATTASHRFSKDPAVRHQKKSTFKAPERSQGSM